MIYVRAGLFSEGPTDDRFLLPLLDRLLDELLARHYTARYELESSRAINAPAEKFSEKRGARIAAAVDQHWDECTLFFVHADGAGDFEAQRRHCIDPGFAETRSRHPDAALVACVPVRETEAWQLADAQVFQERLGVTPTLPPHPERTTDPKLELRKLFESAGDRFSPRTDYAFFGERIRLHALRRLPAFLRLEQEALDALRLLARSQGVHD